MNQQMTREEMQALLAAQAEQIKALQAQAQSKMTLKVGQSGTVALYHGARYPIALYRSQWERILPFIKSGAIEAFISANASLLAADKG